MTTLTSFPAVNLQAFSLAPRKLTVQLLFWISVIIVALSQTVCGTSAVYSVSVVLVALSQTVRGTSAVYSVSVVLVALS